MAPRAGVVIGDDLADRLAAEAAIRAAAAARPHALATGRPIRRGSADGPVGEAIAETDEHDGLVLPRGVDCNWLAFAIGLPMVRRGFSPAPPLPTMRWINASMPR